MPLLSSDADRESVTSVGPATAAPSFMEMVPRGGTVSTVMVSLVPVVIQCSNSSLNRAYTVFSPSSELPPNSSRFHVFAPANGSGADQSMPSLLNCISVTPMPSPAPARSGSEAVRVRVTSRELVKPAPSLISTVPVGGERSTVMVKTSDSTLSSKDV